MEMEWDRVQRIRKERRERAEPTTELELQSEPELQPDPGDQLQQELIGLSRRQVRQRAIAAGVAQRDIDKAQKGSTPKDTVGLQH